jgi:hypothetical protein
MEWVVIPVVIAIVAVFAYISWKAEQARRAELSALADRLGFQFHPDADGDLDDEYAQFEIFRRGHSRAALDTLVGTLEVDGHPCAARCGDFRYRVTHSTGKSTTTTTYRFSYLMVKVPWRHTPPLLVRPEGIFDKLAGAFGFDDIDFESAEFSRRFYVKSSDKKFAYDVIHPRMMEFLLAQQPPMLDLEGGAICCSDGQGRWEPAAYEARIAFVRQFFGLWPRHLLQDLEA